MNSRYVEKCERGFHAVGRAADWASEEIARFGALQHSVSKVVADIECKQKDIAALQRAVSETARTAGRRQAHMLDLADLMEATFEATSPYHLGAARRLAVEAQSVLERAIVCLRDLSCIEAVDRLRDGAIEELADEALVHTQRTAQALSQLLANADDEVQSLQAALIELSASRLDLAHVR